MANQNKIFDINDYIQQNRVFKEKNERDKKNYSTDFYSVLDIVKKHFENKLSDDSKSDEEKKKIQNLEHNAILGDLEAEKIITSEIEHFLRSSNLLGVKYPTVFENLQQAIFHELYRFGIFYKWENYPDSVSAEIIGKEIWFKIDGEFVKQEEELRDEDHINEIIRAIQMGNKRLKINESNPEAEVELKDGTRLKIVIPPASYLPTIVFRRFIVKNFSFNEQTKRNTIAKEDTTFFNNLANSYLNTVIAGHVESGKSTLLKTFFGARDPKKVAILIESSPESFLKRDFPNRLVHEFYVINSDIKNVIRTVLRVDHDYLIVQEVRGIEAEGAIGATERGKRGLLMTYHITDPERTPEQLAQHIVDEYPNRRLINEIRRISKALDIGITMETFEGNRKKLTSLYEICYDNKEDKAWINYLIKYVPDEDYWMYNPNVSEGLIDNIRKYNKEFATGFLEHLKSRSENFPYIGEPIQNIIFKD
jgi:pilus assembly protein CpaF